LFSASISPSTKALSFKPFHLNFIVQFFVY
jgi:hypothetical protein